MNKNKAKKLQVNFFLLPPPGGGGGRCTIFQSAGALAKPVILKEWNPKIKTSFYFFIFLHFRFFLIYFFVFCSYFSGLACAVVFSYPVR